MKRAIDRGAIQIIKANSSVYKLKYEDQVRNHDQQNMEGELQYQQKIMRISTDGRCRQTINQTILHESVHALVTEFDLEECNQESVVERLSSAFFGFIIDNPGFIAEIIVGGEDE